VTTLKPTQVLKGHSYWVSSVAFSPAGKTLASGSFDQSVKLWDWTEEGKNPRTLKGHSSKLRTVAYSPSGELLASAGDDKLVVLWDTAESKIKAVLPDLREWVFSVAFTPDGGSLVTGGGPVRNPGEVTLWDLATYQKKAEIRGHPRVVYEVAIEPHGTLLATAGGDNTVKLRPLSSLLNRK
jgi:WD40 repeat protein